MLQKIEEHWRITVSIKTVKRILKELRMSWHRFRRVHWGHPDPQEYKVKQAELEDLKRLDDQGDM